jgi:hypothetical protein
MAGTIDEYLSEQFKQGRLILFTGAGYSLSAVDTSGRPLPTGKRLAEELWELTYPGEPYDGYSSLQDVFEVCRQKSAKRLSAYLSARLTVDPERLPEFYRDWLNLPWRRAYTLNVDDLFQATATRFELPRGLDTINGLSTTGEFSRPRLANSLEVIHLNGRMSDGIDAVTFSTAQYAERTAGSEPLYHQLVTDIVAFPVVFVGTPLEEPLLWQYLEIRGAKGARGMRELRPRSFLVTPSISRAKEDLLASYNVEIVRMTAEAFADAHIRALSSTTAAGLGALRHTQATRTSTPQTVSPVTLGSTYRSLFLLGAEPQFADVQADLAIKRTVDGELFDLVQKCRRSIKAAPKVVLLGGTAASGKTTSLMRLALRLVAEGKNVGWVGRNHDVSPLSMRKWAEGQTGPVALLVDDVDRYGAEAPRLLRTLLETTQVETLVVATRSSKMDRIAGSALLADEHLSELSMPPLTDEDVDALIDVLTRDNKLGRLKGLSRADQREALKQKCGRQLLVAMLEATSSQSFEDKVYAEWRELNATEQLVYQAVAIAYAHRFPLPRSSLLISLQDVSNEVLNVLDQLTRRHILVQEGNAYRPRHKVVGETLVDRLTSDNPLALAKVLARLTFAAAVEATPPPDRSRREWRYLVSLLNHERLLHTVGVEGARLIYQEVENVLTQDHHFWLQRGSLELEEGNVRLAENYLEQARALDADDYKVQTAYAYMQIKRACSEPNAANADRLVEDAVSILEEQISSRGRQDFYPYHVLGAQCLGWIRRSSWTPTQKTQLLQRVIVVVQDGVTAHPRVTELRGLLKDLRYDLVAVQTGLAPSGAAKP